MELNGIVTLKGTISYYAFPKHGAFYQEIESVGFGMQTKHKERVFVKGYSFNIKVGEAVLVKAKFLGKERGISNYQIITIERLYDDSGKKTALSALVGSNISDRNAIIAYNILVSSENPIEDLTQKIKLSDSEAQKLYNKFKKTNDILNFATKFEKYNFSYKETSKIISRLGDRAEAVIRENPYKLMTSLNWSFAKCDVAGFQSGVLYNSTKRISAGIVAVLRDNELQGNVYTLKQDVLEQSQIKLQASNDEKKLYNVSIEEIQKVYDLLISRNLLVEENGTVFTKDTYAKITSLRTFFEENGYEDAHIIKENAIDAEIREFELEKGFNLGKEQKEAVKNSLSHRTSIITGGPGTGKTTVLACIIWIAMRHSITEGDIALCAPTGKAARRMMESINGQLNTNMYATTIHTLLKVDPTSPELDRFIFNSDNKLEKKFIVCDESSMIDSGLACNLCEAIPDGCQVIFVGDINQLPPVSYGNFLNDIIEAEIPTVKLLEVHRQKGDSSIIGMSQQIRDDKTVDISKKNDFCFVETSDWTYKDKLDKIVSIYGKATLTEDGKHDFEQAVVLTAINGVTGAEQLGIRQINHAIQERFNPSRTDAPEFRKNGYVFRKNSKVMVTKNDNNLGVVNGQTGYILNLDEDEGVITIRFMEDVLNELTGKFETRMNDIDFTGESLDHIVLAYAMTVHKSQGSEWKNVIEVVDEDAGFMNSKKLVYTGITRAKKTLVLFGQKTVIEALKTRKERKRNSCIFPDNKRFKKGQ